jgi:hypothetical protein
MSRIALSILGLFFFQIVSAQWCGTDQAALQPFLDANLKAMVTAERGAVKYVPVTFHLVANAAGNGRVEEENVLKQVLNFNTSYADQNVVFYIDHFNYFDNDAVYNTPSSTLARTQMRLRKDNNSVNIYICNSADSGSGPGVTLAYYDPQEDWIVTRKNEVNGASKTLSHEVGHFFSLAHTHAGWDCFPFTLTDYTNPVSVDFTKACDDQGNGSLLIELHDRSNCATAGDKICDTPEDYNLGLFYQPGCTDNTVIKDKNGEVIKPLTTNYMSYYSDCDTNVFSATQKTLMNTDFFTPRRLYIRTGVIPNTTPVTGPVNYIAPINGQESNGLTNVLLDWEDTPGANKYLVIYDRFANFTFNPTKVFTTTSQYVIPGPLTAGQTIYWKVWPYNESQTGAMYSTTQNFKAGEGTGINEITDIQEYVLSPNPVIDQQPVTLAMTIRHSFDAQLKVVDASNRVLSVEKVNIASGHSELPIKTEGLPAGVYFVVLNADAGSLVEKMLILK